MLYEVDERERSRIIVQIGESIFLETALISLGKEIHAADLCVNIADMASPPPGVPHLELLCGFSHAGPRVFK